MAPRILPATCALLAAGSSAATPDYTAMWSAFKATYDRVYTSDYEVDRFLIFKANVDYIESINVQGLPYTLAVNQFSDASADEFATTYFGMRARRASEESPLLAVHRYRGEVLADSVDWRTQGAVTDVKTQGSCGSCWAFSAIGALEGHWRLASGLLVPLSEQQLVDCDKAMDEGCKGGWPYEAFKYMQGAAVCTGASYPYTHADGSCQASSCTVGVPSGAVTGYMEVEAKSMQSLMSAVQLGPVAAGVEANQQAFQSYKSGVVTGTCGSELNHGVTMIGYGTDSGLSVDYWLLKNSWGASWGEAGYVRLQRGKHGWSSGECGILMANTYPIVAASTLV